MNFKLELIPLIVNVAICMGYAWKGDEPSKTIYWMGATILTIGLYQMKG